MWNWHCKISYEYTTAQNGITFRDLGLPPRCKWGLRSSGVCRLFWLVVRDVLGQPGGHIFKGQAVFLKTKRIGFPETSVANYQTNAALTPQKNEDLGNTFARSAVCSWKRPLLLQLANAVGVHVVSMLSLQNCALVGYYAANSSNLLPTFRDNLSVPSSDVKTWRIFITIFTKANYFGFLIPEDGTDSLSRNVDKEIPLLDAQ